MEGSIVKLSTIASVKGGKRLPKGVALIGTPNEHPYVRVRDLNGKRILERTDEFEYVDNETQKSIARYIVSTGDIIISIVGTIGLVAIIGPTLHNANLTENCVKLTDLSGVDRDYLYYYLISEMGQAEIAKGTVGAVQAKLPIKNIQDIDVKLPDMKVQQKIASILSAIDSKIECNSKINDNLQQQAQAIFSSFYSQATEEIAFTELVKILGGGTPKTGEAMYWDGEIPFFTPKDVGNPYTLSTEKSITQSGLEHCNSRLYPINTVFVTARGTVGKVGLAGVPMAMNQSCYALVGDGIDQLLAYYYTLETVQALKHKASGAVFDAITTRDFTSETVRKLSNDGANAVVEAIRPLFARILNNVIENQHLATLRDTLLPRLMSGEIDVSSISI